MKPLLSVILPTYNEAEALPILARRLKATMAEAGLTYELVIVDDNSADGTGQMAEQLTTDNPIRVLHRPGKAGLASAVLDGLPLAHGSLIGVMDADLSHPPEVLPAMVRAIEMAGADLAVGSRYVIGGRIEDWPMLRRGVSSVANTLTLWLTPVKDATSGFFVIRRTALEGVELNPIGFKIGLEVMAKARYQTFVEVPYIFTDRVHGTSKFGLREVWYFLKQVGTIYLKGETRKRWPQRLIVADQRDGNSHVTPGSEFSA